MNKGFTMIELFVTITIIAILSSALFLEKTKSEKKLALQRAAFQIAQDLREVQEMTMGAKEVNCGGGVYTSSFGIYFHKVSYPNSYIIFADCNGNRQRDIPADDLREVKLEKGVKIFDVSPLVPSYVVFEPPDPFTCINKNEWSDEELVVTIALESDPNNQANQKKIKINSAGRIEIE